MEIEIKLGEEKEMEGKEKEPSDYEIQCAVDYVLKAEEVKNDSKLWPIVKAKLEEKGVAIKTAIKSLDDLRKVAEKKSKEY